MMKLAKKAIKTSRAPSAIGPYSQAIMVGSTLYVSGQLGIVPNTKKFAGEDITSQTHQAMKNILAILEECHMTSKNLVKCTVLLKCMKQFEEFNTVYSQYVEEPFPARATFEVANLPMDGLVEVEAVAIADEVLDD